MHIKFTAHGTGGGKKAMKYLEDEKDYKGEYREEVSVLRGNSKMCGALIDSLPFVHRYRSGLIAWAPKDQPTKEDINGVLDDFEAVAFAGLEPDQYTYSAVLHREKDGGVHVHVIIPRVELDSGKSFNPSPPGWQKWTDLIRDSWNIEKGWARPDDPDRARVLQPGSLALGKALEKSDRLETREMVHQIVKEGVLAGEIVDRAGVLECLSAYGQINRAGRDYISVRFQEGEKPIRFKGVLYGEQFSAAAQRGVEESFGANKAEDRNHEAGRVAGIRQQLEAVVARRASWHQERYGRQPSQHPEGLGAEPEGDEVGDRPVVGGDGGIEWASRRRNHDLDSLEPKDNRRPEQSRQQLSGAADQPEVPKVLPNKGRKERPDVQGTGGAIDEQRNRDLADRAIRESEWAAQRRGGAVSRAGEAVGRSAEYRREAIDRSYRAVGSTESTSEEERFARRRETPRYGATAAGNEATGRKIDESGREVDDVVQGAERADRAISEAHAAAAPVEVQRPTPKPVGRSQERDGMGMSR